MSVRRVYQYVDTGYLKATRFGNLVLVISRPDLDFFLKGLSERRAAFRRPIIRRRHDSRNSRIPPPGVRLDRLSDFPEMKSFPKAKPK